MGRKLSEWWGKNWAESEGKLEGKNYVKELVWNGAENDTKKWADDETKNERMMEQK